MKTKILLSSILLAGGVWGCSLINAPGELNPGTGEDGGAGGDASGGTTGEGGDTGSGGAGTGGETSLEPPTTGLIVAAGTENTGGANVLSVLAATNGEEISREELTVPALAYDEAPNRHIWFTFVSADIPAAGTDVVELRARRYDEDAESWTELGKATSLLPPQQNASIVVLNDRLVYISWKIDNGTPRQAMTVLDTSDPTDITEQDTIFVPVGEELIGIEGLRGQKTDRTAEGGQITALFSTNCNALNECDLEARGYFVGGSLNPGQQAILDKFEGRPSFAAAPDEEVLYAIYKRATSESVGGGTVQLHSFPADAPGDGRSSTVTGSSASLFAGMDMLECQNAALFSDAAQFVGAVHTDSGNVSVSPLGHPGHPVVGEPFRNSALIPGEPGTGAPVPDHAVRSFEVSPSAGNPNLLLVVERTSWTPPIDFMAHTLAVRLPEDRSCP